MNLRYLAMLCLLAPAAVSAAEPAKTITRELLLKNSPVPERREFPLSTTVGACDDFHAYVCGEAENKFQLPGNRSSWTLSLQDNAERLLQAKKNYFALLDQGYKVGSKRAAQYRDYYLSCMNEEASRREEQEFVKAGKDEIGAIRTREQLIDLVGERFRTPHFSFVNFGASANQDDPNYNDVIIQVSALTLPEKSYYDDAAAVADLEKLAVAFFNAAGMDNPEQRAQDVVNFEKALAKVSPSPAEMRKRRTENRYRDRASFAKEYPSLPLAKLFALIPASTKTRDHAPETMKFASDALASMPLEQLKNVFLFKELYGKIDDSNPEYFQVLFGFMQRQKGGPKERPDRQERCTGAVEDAFGMELDAELIPVLFPNFPSDRMEKTAERVRAAIVKGLKKNSWLSDTARAEAIRKVGKADLMLVQPKREIDWHFLPIMKYDPAKPLTNQQRLEQAQIDRELKELKSKRNRREWSMSPLTVNAYYSPADNKFVLPLGILQYPVFDEKMSDIENIGAIGVVVGHELGHGIDDSGSKYDHQGRLRNWKTEEDKKQFDERAQKFVDLYNGYGHNGQLTLGENIGDHEGVTFAFDAAFPDASKAKPEDVRKFFLAYGRLWCNKALPEAEKLRLKTDPHSLGWARINGQVIQNDGFQNAFACQPGQKMYVAPADRIRVW